MRENLSMYSKTDTYGDDDGVYYYFDIDERLKLEREPDKSVF